MAIAAAIALEGQVPPPDPRELVRQSIVNGEKDWEKAQQYQYTKVAVKEEFGSDGELKSRDEDVYEVLPVQGAAFEMHVRHNGEAVPASEMESQQLKLAERRRETEAQAAEREAKEKADRAYIHEVPDAFDFRVIGEETLPAGPAWVLEATPRRGFQPRSRYARFFPKMKGTLWIDQTDVQWVKADAVATGTVSFGFLIARLSRGSRIILEQTRLADGIWAPKRLVARASTRTFLFFRHNFRQEITYEDFRRPGTEMEAWR